MAIPIKPPRILFSFTCILLLIIAGSVYLSRPTLPPSIPINTNGQPTIGFAKARVHVLVFEEPKCTNCKHFTEQIFPVIKKDFIDTHKITYTVIPVSFLTGSMPAATALLCVYYQNPRFPNDELFFKYLDYMYEHEGGEDTDWAKEETLIQFAKETSPAIEIPKLKECIEKEAYRVQIERNTANATQVMGGEVLTPTVYVNGIKVEQLTEENLRNLILEVLEHEGVR